MHEQVLRGIHAAASFQRRNEYRSLQVFGWVARVIAGYCVVNLLWCAYALASYASDPPASADRDVALLYLDLIGMTTVLLVSIISIHVWLFAGLASVFMGEVMLALRDMLMGRQEGQQYYSRRS